jgi:hypothetical protein
MVNIQQKVNQQKVNQQKVNQQVNRPAGRKVHPERLRLIAEARRIPRVRVEPTSEEFRRAIRHPSGMRFRPEGSVEWPNDRFTQRRVAEGSVRIVEAADDRQQPPPTNGPQESAESNPVPEIKRR